MLRFVALDAFLVLLAQPIRPQVQPRTLSIFLGSTVPRYKKLILCADAKEKKSVQAPSHGHITLRRMQRWIKLCPC